MNDTKPTANAATTVVSTPGCAAAPRTAAPTIRAAVGGRPAWPVRVGCVPAGSPAVEGGQLGVEPARLIRIELRPRGLRGGARRAAPAVRRDGDTREAPRHQQPGDHVDREVEALVVGQRQDGGAVRLRQPALDLRLVLALGDAPADERP